MINYKKHTLPLFIVGLFIVAFGFRFSGIIHHHPFWIDEFNSGIQAKNFQRLILRQPAPPYQVLIEKNNYLSHFLIALSFIAFGQSESAARLPFVIIGSLVPLAIFFLVKKYYGLATATSASLLVTFAYFEIAWSTQARGYVLQQLLSVLLFISYFTWLEKKQHSPKLVFLMILFAILGLLTHNMFILVIFTLILHFLIFNFKNFLAIIKKPIYTLPTILFFSAVFYFGGFIGVFSSSLFSLFNNLWYYHALLWRQYSLISFLAFVGIIWGLKKNLSLTSLLIFFILAQLILVTFFFGHYMSKYILPIFQFLLLFAGLGIAFISRNLAANFFKNKKRGTIILSLILTGFIILNGNKFVTRPKAFYSIDHDVRDIALVDYDQVYGLIKRKSGDNLDEVAVADPWTDRTRWYLGPNFQNIFLFRWSNGGFRKTTQFYVDKKGQKILPGTSMPLIAELADLKKAMTQYPKGFIWIDDTSLPADVINYVKANFKEELHLDHYRYDDNPYSIWPGTLYSWGFETNNPFYQPSHEVNNHE